ncbi:MAG: hypothetical protein JW953_17080 [Anaerolineae bacterium]|nr:hypothetical protein [Anaerolineae bacterium]
MLLNQTLQLITAGLWILFGVFIVAYLVVVVRRRGLWAALRGLITRITVLFLLVLFIITFINASAVFIEPQEVGIVISVLAPDGYYDRPLRSGLRWIVPVLEQVKRYPIYWQTYTMSSKLSEGEKMGDDSITARTSDGQEVSLDCSLIFQLDPEQVMRIHIDWQDRYIEDFVRPVTRGVIRTLVSQYTVDEVNSSKRLDLERDINQQLRDVFGDKGFVLDRFILRNIMFSPEYATAVEQKQVATQQIVQSEHKANTIRRLAQGEADAIRLKAQAEADAIRLKGQAEADAFRVIAEALARDKDLLTYQYINKLSPAIRVMLVPSNTPYLLPLPDLNANDTPAMTIPITATVPITPTEPVTATQPVTTTEQ